jgi:hypothetical protein
MIKLKKQEDKEDPTKNLTTIEPAFAAKRTNAIQRLAK